MTPQQIGALVVTLGADASQYDRALGQAEQRATRTSGKLAADFAKIGAAATAAFTAVAAVSVREFAKFEEQMVKSTAIMGDVSASLRREMEDTARSISRNSVTSAAGLAEAYYFLAAAGMDAEQSIAALGQMEQFAVAGAFNMARATDLVTDAQSALGLTSKDATENLEGLVRVSDVLVKANTLANASVEQFSIALTNKAAVALRNLNKDVEEGVAVLAAYADQGIKAERAGEQLSIVLRDLQRASQSNTEVWEEFGLRVYDAQGNMLPIVDIISQLEGRFEGASDEMRRAGLELLGFQDRSVMAIQTLMGTSEQIRKYEEALRDAGGMTQEVYEKQLMSFNAQMQILKNRVTDVSIEIGQALVPILIQLNEILGNAYDTTGEFSDQVQYLVDIMKTGLLVAIQVVGDAIQGWNIVIKAGEVALLFMVENVIAGVTRLPRAIGAVMEAVGQGIVAGVNFVVRQINRVIESVPDWVKKRMGAGDGTALLQEIEFNLNLGSTLGTDLQDSVGGARRQALQELEELMGQERFSASFMSAYTQNVEKARDATATLSAQSNETFKKIIDDAEEAGTGVSQSFEKSTDDIVREFRTKEQAIKTGFIDPVNDGLNSMNRNIDGLVRSTQTWDGALVDISQTITSSLLQSLTTVLVQWATQQALVTAGITATSQAAIGTATATAAGAAGLVSAAWTPAAIAASIATMGQASAIGTTAFSAALAAGTAASVAASSIGSFASSFMSSFAGAAGGIAGARAMGGPVAGGKSYLVGERGPELFTPNSSGFITPNDRLGQSVQVIINNLPGQDAQVTEDENELGKIISITVTKTRQEIASDIQTGGTKVAKAMEQAYGLRRGRTR